MMVAVRVRDIYTRKGTNWRCRLFGHVWSGGWYGSLPYFSIQEFGHDNIGRIHGNLYMTCDRCNKKVNVGHIHLNDPVIVEALDNVDSR